MLEKILSASKTILTSNRYSQSILIIQSTIACVGIVANLTVIVVFLNHKKLRGKIPNIFIINQVRKATDDCKTTFPLDPRTLKPDPLSEAFTT